MTTSIQTQKGSGKKVELKVLPLYQGTKLESALAGIEKDSQSTIKKLAKQQDFQGKSGESLRFNTSDGQHIVLFGLGEDKDETANYYHIGGKAARLAQQLKVKQGNVTLSGNLNSPQLYSLSLGLHLGNYTFDTFKKEKSKAPAQTWTLASSLDSKASDKAIKRAKINAESISSARDLVNLPGNELTPQALAEHAKVVAKKNQLKIKVLNKAACAKKKMDLFLSVGAGSTANPPLLIHMSYVPKGKASKRKVFLVGKGVTFDSGGLSLKSGAGMMEMKIDMGGSAAVISTMESIAKLKPNFEVHAIVAATENMPDGNSTRPGDIVKAMDGTTVEILNTDAEGRLTLADAITYSKQEGATEIIDLATLTGACMVALGPITAALYSDHNEVAEGLLQAADIAHESLWRMPLTKKLNKMLKSPVADLKNIGESYGGSITAAMFLQHFTGDTPWAHLDIAGPAFTKEDDGPITKGGTGYGVHTLVEYLVPQ